jgi:hypothetical protein
MTDIADTLRRLACDWPQTQLADVFERAAGEIERLRVHLDYGLDCRTCRHHTTQTGGCISVLRCEAGSAYQRIAPRQCWSTL